MNKMIIKKNILIAVLFVVAFLAVSEVSLAAAPCANGTLLTATEAAQYKARGIIRVDINKISSSQVRTTVYNDTACSLPIRVNSYKMYDNVSEQTQKQIDTSGIENILPGQSKTFITAMANCLTQVDAFYDQGGNNYHNLLGMIFGVDGRVFASIPAAQGLFCSDTPPPPVNSLSVSCDADDSTIEVDEDVTYRAEVSGGTGSYSYDWDGSENLRGSSRSVTWSYDDDGSKYATVTVTSGNQTATASCRVRVDEEDNNDEDLDVSCYANPTNPRIGERMNWYADVDGGDGDYDYDWSGTDGLDSSSRSPSMTYYDGGTKTATVRVRSDGETETATCRINVNQNTVLSYSQSYPNQVLDAVYLNQVPYTGVADNMSVIWFTLGLALFSAWIAYIVIAYKKQVGEVE